MASGSTSSLLGSSDEKHNGMKLMRLVLDGGTEALKNVFQRIHPGNLQVVLSCTCSSSFTCNYHCLSQLKKRKIINQNQWDKLYPPHPSKQNVNDFDITLLSVLLRNICGLSPPSTTGWDNVPTPLDHSVEADIVRIKLFRNKHFGHRPQSAVSEADFKALWAEISSPLVRLGIDQKEIDRLENEECGEEDMKRIWNALEEYRNVLNETRNAVKENWNVLNQTRNVVEENRNVLNETRNAVEENRNVLNETRDVVEGNRNVLNETRNAVEENRNVLNETRDVAEENKNVLKETRNTVVEIRNEVKELREEDPLKKHLVQFNFQAEIDFFNGKCTTGSREWVLNHVHTWLNQTYSENRAFVISDVAGMGKSVIAAVICKRFVEHVGACHFFKYNDSQYNNPNFFLQSLAWQLCKVLPAYKETLIQKLSGNLGNPLNDMNIQGLFSVLFKEPFSSISGPGKHILIVLDAVDESEYRGRHELAELISNRFHELPSYLRFLITSRPQDNLVFAFRELKPLSMQANDKENLNDIKLVLQDKIPCSNQSAPDFINSLAQKCDGSMLYAYVLTELYKDNSSVFAIDSLPRNVEGYFKICFERLERDLLKPVGVCRTSFLCFLDALAVAKEPLPEEFLGTIFGFENPADAKDKLAKAINVLSLFLTKEDKGISFFHKSVRDWLVDPCRKHYPHINVQYGHKILFDLCVKKLDELKQKGVSKKRVSSVVVRYALKYWTFHMLEGLEDAGKLEGFVDSYLIDLEVMFASVFLDVNVALMNLRSLESHEISKDMSASARESVKKLYSLIQKFAFSLQKYPQTFLQNVVNEGEEQLSSKASDLLGTRYRDIFYFQLDKHDRQNDAVEARCYLSGTIKSIDVSPNHDYVVCGYEEGGIELFFIATGMSEWKKDFVVLSPLFYTSKLPHQVVFHPHENLILPGRLDKVLTLQGKFIEGPFHCDDGSSKFSNCCFTMDGSRMVTNNDNGLFVWNVYNGRRERSISCHPLCSSSFSASGNLLATVDIDNVFSVYDVTNDYKVNYRRIELPVEIVSTFDHNSWLCSVDSMLKLVSHDLVLSSSLGSELTTPLPGNHRPLREFQRFLQHPEESWLSKVRFRYPISRYFLIGDKYLLLFSWGVSIMRLISIEGIIQTEQSLSNVKEYVVTNISLNGDFVYLSNLSTNNFTLCKLPSQDKYPRSLTKKINFLVVRDGVIFYSEGHACIPELWNSDVTQCLSSFDKLNGTMNCLSVSDEVIACVCDQTAGKCRIIFLNVSTKEIEKELSINENSPSGFHMVVRACSIKYHVLTKYFESSKYFLWKDGKEMDWWKDLFYQESTQRYIYDSQFSPDGNKLAICCNDSNKISIFDIASEIVQAQIATVGSGMYQYLVIKFFDNENLLYSSVDNMLYCINTNSREILTCLDIGARAGNISVCRKRNIVCVGFRYSKNFKLVTVCPPRRSHTIAGFN